MGIQVTFQRTSAHRDCGSGSTEQREDVGLCLFTASLLGQGQLGKCGCFWVRIFLVSIFKDTGEGKLHL